MRIQYLGWVSDICSTDKTISETGKAPAIGSDRFFSALLIKRLISDVEPIKSRSRCDGEHFVERRAEGVWRRRASDPRCRSGDRRERVLRVSRSVRLRQIHLAAD